MLMFCWRVLNGWSYRLFQNIRYYNYILPYTGILDLLDNFTHIWVPMWYMDRFLCALSQYSRRLFTSLLFGTPWIVALQAPLSMGILQAKVLEWIAMSSSRVSSQPRDQIQLSYIAGRFFTSWAIREAQIIYTWTYIHSFLGYFSM